MNTAIKFMGLVAIGAMTVAGPAKAQELNARTLFTELVSKHATVLSAESEVVASQEDVTTAKGGWAPTFSIDGSIGREDIKKDAADDTDMGYHQIDTKLTQLLYDFGQVDAAISQEEARLATAEAELRRDREQLLFNGISAYLNLKRYYTVLEYAKRSEQNIKKQQNLESSRIDAGRGYRTDELQARSELAAAKARRVAAQSAWENAVHRFEAVFGIRQDNPTGLPAVVMPTGIPETIEEVFAQSEKNNAILRVARTAVSESEAARTVAKADEWAPTFNLVAYHSYENDVSGTVGSQRDLGVKVEATWELNTALTGLNVVRAATAKLSAAQSDADNTLLSVHEQARQAWSELRASRERFEFLRDQADIREEFLKLARQERELGKRSLLDVLNGETALFNAQAEAAVAQTDILIAAYALLFNMGELNLDTLLLDEG